MSAKRKVHVWRLAWHYVAALFVTMVAPIALMVDWKGCMARCPNGRRVIVAEILSVWRMGGS